MEKVDLKKNFLKEELTDSKMLSYINGGQVEDINFDEFDYLYYNGSHYESLIVSDRKYSVRKYLASAKTSKA